jgi:hypothetical protein
VEFKLRVLTALDVNDGNIYKTAQQFGIGRANVSDWNQKREQLFEQGETLLQQKRLHLAQRMELIVNQIVDSLPKKVEKARLSDSAQALRLLINLSAEIEAKQAAEEERSSDVYAKLAKLLERYGAPPENTGEETT